MRRRPITAILATVLLGAVQTSAQERIDQLRHQFQQENEPVRQAKLFPKLGDALIRQVKKDADARDYPAALESLREYRDDSRRVIDALKATGRNAEKKSAGFRELEIHLRKSLRDVNAIVVSLPYDQKQPFEPAQRELEEMDQELIHMLFPRQPEHKQAARKPQS